MERISSIDQERVEYWRGADVDVGAGEHVLPGTRLKRDDDVLIFGSLLARIIGPGPSDTCIMIYGPEWFGDACVPVEVQTVAEDLILDRAPADPNETPMPITIASEEPAP